MAVINHLKDVDSKSLIRTIAYGRHLVTGVLAKSIVSGSDPNHTIKLQQLLGRDEWEEIEKLYWNNIAILPAKYFFHPGSLSTGFADPVQGTDTVFDDDSPHSGTPWLSVELAQGFGEFDTKSSPPYGLQAYCKTKKVNNFSNVGDVTDFSFSTNPARQVADLILKQGKRDSSLIDWGAWKDWHDYLAQKEEQDYTLLPGFDGFGLTGTYYEGTNFDTLHSQRIDTVIFFEPSAGSPAYNLDADDFSVRFEGKLKFEFAEEYTFSLYYDKGAKLYINDTLLIDDWAGASNFGTANFTPTTAGEFATIKIEWFDDAADARLQLDWESTSVAKEVIPSKYLYPKQLDRAIYETHPFFSSQTRLDDAVRTVLNLCNSSYQFVNGKYRFFCLEQLSESSFEFKKFLKNSVEENALSVSLKAWDRVNLRNRFTCSFRDTDSRFLEPPTKQFVIENDELIELAGKTNDGDDLNFYNCTRWQAWKLLNIIADRETKARPIEIKGRATSYPVLAGDRVKVTAEKFEFEEKEYLVTQSRDASAEETADEREFSLQEWV